MLTPSQKKNLAGIFLAVVFYFVFALGYKLLWHQQVHMVASRFIIWLWLALLWLYASRIEHLSLFGEAQVIYPFWQWILFVVFVLISVVVSSAMLGITLRYLHLFTKSPQIKVLLMMPFPVKLFGIITAGITEELIFRGYLLSRLNLLIPNRVAPVFITAVLFGLIHTGYGTLVNVMGPLFIGIVFGTFQQCYRNIYVLIACHILIDAIALKLF